MSPPAFSPEELADRAAIQDVITLYCNAVDRRDFDGVASCFTDDATAVYGGVTIEPGGDGVVRFLKQLRPLDGDRHVGTHLLGNLLITLRGDEADAESYVIAYSVPADPAAPVRMRGLRYRDRLVRLPAGWKIAGRVHSADWEGGVPNIPVTPIQPQAR